MSAIAEPSTSRRATVTDESEEIEIPAESSGGAKQEVEPSTSTSEPIPAAAAAAVAGQEGETTEPKEEIQPPQSQPEPEVYDPNRIPEDACVTLYLQNLNEKVRVQVMTETLANLFKSYRPVLPIVAHRNVRMRGQAFVTFQDVETANKARREVGEFPLYGKPVQIKFAKTRSDSAVKRAEGEEGLEEWKKTRLAEKKKHRRDNVLRRKHAARLRADDATSAFPPGTTPLGGTAAAGSSSAAPAAKRAKVQMPDEYLPPNNVLFIQNLPEGTTQEDLREVFELHAGLLEIRTIPAKKDIAFVEFSDEATATIAKDALHNFKIDGETKMKVTYAKK